MSMLLRENTRVWPSVKGPVRGWCPEPGVPRDEPCTSGRPSPRRVGEQRLACGSERLPVGRSVRPDHCRLAILPLDADGVVSDVVAAVVDREVTKPGLSLHLQHYSVGSSPRDRLCRSGSS